MQSTNTKGKLETLVNDVGWILGYMDYGESTKKSFQHLPHHVPRRASQFLV